MDKTKHEACIAGSDGHKHRNTPGTANKYL